MAPGVEQAPVAAAPAPAVDAFAAAAGVEVEGVVGTARGGLQELLVAAAGTEPAAAVAGIVAAAGIAVAAAVGTAAVVAADAAAAGEGSETRGDRECQIIRMVLRLI